MAEFVEVMKQMNRMCDFFNKEYGCCDYCGIKKLANEKDTYCNKALLFNNPQDAEEIIMNWAKEHPIKTNADKFKEVFGVDVDEDNCCLFNCGNNVCSKCEYKDFWQQEYKEPK